MIIRIAKLEDAVSLKHLFSQLQPEDPEVPLNDFTRSLKSILKSNHLMLYVAELEGQVVATCYLNVIENLTRQLAPYAVLENVVTDKKYRGQGIGKAVVTHAIQEAWALGCYKVMLLTGSKHEATLAFYKQCGFEMGSKTAFLAKPNHLL